MFLFPVVNFRAIGEQEHGKDTSCHYMVVLYFLQTWDCWLCSLSKVVRVRLRPCTSQVRLWVKQQKQWNLSACRTSTFCSFFVDYKTLWLQFCWENLLTLPSHPSLDRSSKELFLCALKYLNPPSPMFLKMKPKDRFTFAAHYKLLKKDQVSFSRLFRWEFPLRKWKLCVSLC